MRSSVLFDSIHTKHLHSYIFHVKQTHKITFYFYVCTFRNLRKTESRKNKLEDQLNSVGAKVNELKEKYASSHLILLLYGDYLYLTSPDVKLPKIGKKHRCS